MGTEEDVNTGEDTEVVSTPEPKSTTPPVQKTDYEAGYKGLQRKYDRLQKQYEEAVSKYDALAEESESHKQSKRSVDQEKEQLAKEKVDLELKVKDYEKQLANQNLRNERFNVIMTDYADLAPFESKGLLPDAPDMDTLRQKLEAFRETLGANTQAKVEETVKGAGAGAGAGNTGKDVGKRSKEQVYDELVALAGNKTPEAKAKYDALMKDWIEMN